MSVPQVYFFFCFIGYKNKSSPSLQLYTFLGWGLRSINEYNYKDFIKYFSNFNSLNFFIIPFFIINIIYFNLFKETIFISITIAVYGLKSYMVLKYGAFLC